MSTGSGAPAIAPGAVDGTERAVCHCPHPRDGRSPSRLPALSPERLARARPLLAVQTRLRAADPNPPHPVELPPIVPSARGLSAQP